LSISHREHKSKENLEKYRKSAKKKAKRPPGSIDYKGNRDILGW
jgi:hypothetical protein